MAPPDPPAGAYIHNHPLHIISLKMKQEVLKLTKLVIYMYKFKFTFQ